MPGGDQASPLLIVVHGANGSAAEMRPLTDQLPPGLPFRAFDMLGHGGRPLPDRLTIPDIADDLLSQCDKAGIAAAHWFGFSVGGMAALWLAAYRPERVLSVSALTPKTIYDDRAIAHALHLTDPARLERAGNARTKRLASIHAPQD